MNLLTTDTIILFTGQPVAASTPTLRMPLSKSIAARQVVIDALCGIKSPIPVTGVSDDIRRIGMAPMGPGEVEVNIGASGTAMRLLTAYYAQCPNTVCRLSGVARMHQRPIAILVEALRQLGADIKYLQKDGYPPLLITGTELAGGQCTIDGSVSSQYISALMLIAPHMRHGLQLTLTGAHIASWPYILLTANVMRQHGIIVSIEGNVITVEPGRYSAASQPIEADWSAAAFWYAICAVSGQEMVLKGLCLPSLQGDAEVAKIFEPLGVATRTLSDGVAISRVEVPKQKSVDLDMEPTPDMVPALAVVMCLLHQPYTLRGVANLRLKECDRIEAIVTELSKLGYAVQATDDTLVYDGNHTAPTSQVCIHTYDDHRIAMAFATAAYIYPGLRIQNPSCVEKSYPDFWTHLQQIGVLITR